MTFSYLEHAFVPMHPNRSNGSNSKILFLAM